jgi:hypothetical protein
MRKSDHPALAGVDAFFGKAFGSQSILFEVIEDFSKDSRGVQERGHGA